MELVDIMRNILLNFFCCFWQFLQVLFIKVLFSTGKTFFLYFHYNINILKPYTGCIVIFSKTNQINILAMRNFSKNSVLKQISQKIKHYFHLMTQKDKFKTRYF